jgi:polyhydroxybutyrate depolymerase
MELQVITWTRTLAFSALTSLLAGCAGLARHNMVHDGVDRSYYLHEPEIREGTIQGPMPLVVVLHGAGSNGPSAAKRTQMNPKADEEGFLAAYPNAIRFRWIRLWNAGICCGPAVSENVDDVGFIKTVIEDIESRYDIDPKRIYVAGFSNGAMMAHRVACETVDRIAAVALVAGTADLEHCTPSEPVSVIAFHGTADPRLSYEGGDFAGHAGGLPYPGVREVVAFWRTADNCIRSLPPQESEFLRIEQHIDGGNASEVVLYTIINGNHTWPGGKRVPLIFGRRPTRAVSATDRIWVFFQRHPKP